jgi:cytosine/uracil/thiamine/allantoin permease
LTAIVGLLGIFTAAAAQSAYGQVMWNPIDIISMWMDSGSHGGRAAAAFAAIGLIIVTLGINISANSISAANDLMSFCPKYINIRRGQLLAAVIGSWGFVPVSRRATLSSYYSLTSTVVENPRVCEKVPCFPRWLYYLPGAHDIHSHD